MTPDELLQRWKVMSGDASSRAWASENAYGFLHGYCRDAKTLRAALKGVPRAAAIAERLGAVFAAAGDGGDSAYLLVQRPQRLAEKTAIALAKSHLQSIREMARELGYEEAEALANRVVEFRVTTKPPGRRPTRSQSEFYTLEGDWFLRVCDDTFAHAMGDAAYSLAADPLLAHYVLWPLARRRSDPYAAYFELWRHGVVLRWPKPQVMSLHLPKVGVAARRS